MSGFFLLDSSAWLFNLGPDPVPEIRERVSFLVGKGQVAVVGPILFELLSYPGERPLRSALSEYLLALRVVPFTDADWREAADWTADARRHGAAVRSMDALISFVAHKHRLTLLHADADLDKLARKLHFKVESHVDAARRWSARHR